MYLQVLKWQERLGLSFWSLNDSEKRRTNAFSSCELKTKLCLVYLEVKLQENICGICIY